MRALLLIITVFVKTILVSNNLTFDEIRLKYNYQQGNYSRSFLIAKNNLKGLQTSPIVSYCYALSLFKIQENNIKPNVLDRVLNYLKISKTKTDEHVLKLSNKDSTVLLQIKSKAIAFSESEINKIPKQTLKRLETIIAIYGDTAEIYKVYHLQEKQRKMNYKKIKDSVLVSKIDSVKSTEKLIYTVDKVSSKQLLTDTLEKLCQSKLSNEQKLILQTAFQYQCVSRYPNRKSNPQIITFFHDIGFKSINDDNISWCAAFVNYCLKKNGYNYSHSLLAKDWLKTGVETKNPLPGDIVVFWRGKKSGWQGHVAFYVREDLKNNLVYVYGGNQEGSVCLKPFPKNQVVAYRRPVK